MRRTLKWGGIVLGNLATVLFLFATGLSIAGTARISQKYIILGEV